MKYALLISIVLWSLVSCAEHKKNVVSDVLPISYNGRPVVKSGAILKDVLNENPLIEMETFNEVVLDSIHDDLAFLRIYIVLNHQQFTDRIVKKGTIITSEENRILGVAMEDIEIHHFIENKRGNYYSGHIECVTGINNFYRESIVENRVNDIIVKQGDSLELFEDLFEIEGLNEIDSSDFNDFLKDDEFVELLTELSEFPNWADLKIEYFGLGLSDYTFYLMFIFERNHLVSASSSRAIYVPNWTHVKTSNSKYHISVKPCLTTNEEHQKIELTKWLLRNL